MNKKELLPVIMRKDKTWGQVYALFPTLPGDMNKHNCLSYMTVGQHSAASLAWCISRSRPASPEESADLLQELGRIYGDDYWVVVVKRVTDKMNLIRHEALANF